MRCVLKLMFLSVLSKTLNLTSLYIKTPVVTKQAMTTASKTAKNTFSFPLTAAPFTGIPMLSRNCPETTNKKKQLNGLFVVDFSN